MACEFQCLGDMLTVHIFLEHSKRFYLHGVFGNLIVFTSGGNSFPITWCRVIFGVGRGGRAGRFDGVAGNSGYVCRIKADNKSVFRL